MPEIDTREFDVRLLGQVRGEYLEMPGLQLTVEQASRLWSVKLERAACALDRLVDSRFLRREGDCYARADCGRVCV